MGKTSRIEWSDEFDAYLEAIQKKTGLGIKGVMNEAFTLYERAVRAREEGGNIAVVDRMDNVTVLNTPGLGHVATADSSKYLPHRGSAAPTASCAEPQIGDVMPAGHPNAGWIYMGPDEETGKDFYAAPKDESGTFTFNQAARRAASIGAKMPSQSQLDKMYRHRDKGALKGTFNESGSDTAGWYWSSRDYGFIYAWAQRFSDGLQGYNFKYNASSLRLVR